MSELKSCPFCGGDAERVDRDNVDGGGSFIHCKRCDASSAIHFDRRENLISWWNRRCAKTEDALVEALEMVRDADEDCKRDGLKTMPPMARAKIDAALKLARSEA